MEMRLRAKGVAIIYYHHPVGHLSTTPRLRQTEPSAGGSRIAAARRDRKVSAALATPT
jgi:hypothetical protein